MIGLILTKWKMITGVVLILLVSFFVFNYIKRGKTIEDRNNKIETLTNSLNLEKIKRQTDFINYESSLLASEENSKFIEEIDSIKLETNTLNETFEKIKQREERK